MSTEGPDEQLRRDLRAADPAASLPDDPALLDRLTRRALEAPMSTTPSSAPARRWLPAVAAAAVLLVAGLAFALTRENDDAPVAGASDDRTTVALAFPSAVAPRCIPVSAELLAGQELALRGTATELSGDEVTLEVDRWYAGGEADLVSLRTADAPTTVWGDVLFEVGEDYLLAAADGKVTLCGFSGPATPALQTVYDEAFGS